MKLSNIIKNIKKTKSYPFGLFLNPYDDIPINGDIFRNKTFMWVYCGLNDRLENYPIYPNIRINKIKDLFRVLMKQYSFIVNFKRYYFHINTITYIIRNDI